MGATMVALSASAFQSAKAPVASGINCLGLLIDYRKANGDFWFWLVVGDSNMSRNMEAHFPLGFLGADFSLGAASLFLWVWDCPVHGFNSLFFDLFRSANWWWAHTGTSLSTPFTCRMLAWWALGNWLQGYKTDQLWWGCKNEAGPCSEVDLYPLAALKCHLAVRQVDEGFHQVFHHLDEIPL